MLAKRAFPLDKSVYSVYNKSMDSKEIIKRLEGDGWQLVHVKGSHHKFKHPDICNPVTVPHPRKDLPIGTVKNIFRQAGWKWR